MPHIPARTERATWRTSILTLFPEMFPGPLGLSLVGQALTAGIWSLETTQIRDFGLGRHRAVDDHPAGGGAGMVLRPDVLAATIDKARETNGDLPLLYMSPRGEPLTQRLVRELSDGPGVMILAGRLSRRRGRGASSKPAPCAKSRSAITFSPAGEIPAMVLLDACVRLLPGVLGAAASLGEESFEAGLLEYPHYTKPREWDGRDTPPVLLSGDHKKIAEWRRTEALRITHERRPDLFVGRVSRRRNPPD